MVSNLAGVAISSGAVLTVTPTPPFIWGPYGGGTASIGSEFSVMVFVDGTGPNSFQWSKDGLPISGATDYSYSISNVQLSDAGSYTVTVTSPYGTAVSKPAVLTVIAGPP